MQRSFNSKLSLRHQRGRPDERGLGAALQKPADGGSTCSYKTGPLMNPGRWIAEPLPTYKKRLHV